MLNRLFVVDSVTLTSTGTAVSTYTPWEQTTRKLPTQVVVKATGQGAYVRLSNDASAATNADVLVQGGDHVVLSVQGRRWVSVLSDGASSTVNVGALSTGVSGSAASLDLPFTGVSTLDSRVTFTRASSATFVGSNGLIQSATTNTPRFDYDPVTLAAKGLLIEEQRTNLLTYSEQFDNAAWTKSGAGTGFAPVVTANAAIAPDGSTSADLVVFNRGAGNTLADQSILTQASIATTISTNYAGSFYIKAATVSDIGKQLAFRHVGAAAYLVITLTADWQRISRTDAAVGTSSSFDIANRGTATADNTVSAHLWGAQLEAGAFATSYIPTVASQVTRSADVASVNTLSPWYNATEGTFFADFIPYLSTGNGGALSANDGTSSNRIDLRRDGFSLVTTAGVGQASMSVAGMTANVSNRLAVGYAVNNFALVRNGGAVTTDTSGTVPTGINAFLIGNLDSGPFYLSGTIRRITYYPRRLSNAELQAITA